MVLAHTTCHCCLLISDIAVELDEHTKTPALVLSADRLEASNPNWTFESVHATLCIGRGMCAMSPYPAGWYYEVTLKSTGILQIGTIILRLASTTSVCFGSTCLYVVFPDMLAVINIPFNARAIMALGLTSIIDTSTAHVRVEEV